MKRIILLFIFNDTVNRVGRSVQLWDDSELLTGKDAEGRGLGLI
jgi:hypothetical protein